MRAKRIVPAPPDGAFRAREGDPERERRYTRLYAELERPARAMLRRAFGGTFSDEEIEDLYGNAWLGTLHALRRSGRELGEEELRRYVLTAVANQASRELRRRGRRPTAPLELADRVPDMAELPDERVLSSERTSVARDVLGTLPPRRRAVLVFRYGWGLEPEEVRRVVRGLSPRAYRREVSRGVEEVARKLGLVEAGAWCEDREPVLEAYASGTAGHEERREAQRHLSHCRSCASLVSSLSGRLHDLGSPLILGGLLEGLAGERSPIGRLEGTLARAKEAALGLVARGGDLDATAGIGAAGSARGAGAAGTGALAKLAGAGGLPKLIALCAGGGAAATACAVAAIAPAIGGGERARAQPAAVERSHEGAPGDQVSVALHVSTPGPDESVGSNGSDESAPGEGTEDGESPESTPEPGTPSLPPASAPFEPTGSYTSASPGAGSSGGEESGGGSGAAGGGSAGLAP